MQYRFDAIDLARLRWMMGNLLILTAFVAVRIMEVVSPFLLAGAILLLGAGTLLPRLTQLIPRAAGRFGVVLLILFAILDFLSSGRDVLPPLIRLVILLGLVRGLQVRRQREDFQVALLALFLVVVAGVFTLSLEFAVQVVLFCPLAILFLFLSNICGLEEDGEFLDLRWDEFLWRTFLPRVWRAMDFRIFGYGTLLLGIFFVIGGLIFVAIPRFKWAQALPFFQVGGSAETGFSDTVSLGSVTSIVESDRVAFRIDLSDPGLLPAEPYWRMLMLDRYDSGSFVHSDLSGSVREPTVMESRFIPVGEILSAERRGPRTREPWTFYYEGNVSRYLPLLGPTAELHFQQRQKLEINGSYHTVALPETLANLFFFRADGIRFTDRFPVDSRDAAILNRLQGPLWVDPEDRTALRQMPYPETTLALQLAEPDREALLATLQGVLPGGTDDPETAVRTLSAYLASAHSYSLQSPASTPGRDPVVDWMNSGRDGHCEYFAGALVLLARAAGIPARMVVGFAGGSWNEYEDFYVVRNRNAHAWVEFYSGGAWVRIDPTPSAGTPGLTGLVAGETGALQRESGISAWVDSLRILWYRRIVNFDETDQEAIADRVTGFWKGLEGDLAGWLDRIRVNLRALRQQLAGLPFGEVILGLTLAVVATVLYFLARGSPRILRRLKGSRRRRAGSDVLYGERSTARKLLLRLERLRSRKKVSQIPEYMQECASRLREVRFGPDPRGPASREALREARRALRRFAREAG